MGRGKNGGERNSQTERDILLLLKYARFKVNPPYKQGDRPWWFATVFCRLPFGSSAILPICHATSAQFSPAQAELG